MTEQIFKHTQVELPQNAVFKISPSQIASFFNYPINWYKSEVLGESTFTGNTAAVLGTAIHYVAEQYAKHAIAGTMLNPNLLKKELEAQLAELDNPDVDKDEVLGLYRDMSMALVNEYLSTNTPSLVEYSTVAEVKNGIYVGGSVDNRTGSVIVDYKNVGTKPNTDTIPWNYFIQLMAYAWADKQRGIETDILRLVYTVRPTKTLPIRVFEVNHQITRADWQAIEDVLTIISNTVLLSIENPELNYLLFKSMQLKA